MIGEHVLGFVPGEPVPEHPFAILPRMPTPGAATATAPQPAAAADDDLRAVLARIVQREESALRELYDASVGRVYGLALRIPAAAMPPRKSPPMSMSRSGAMPPVMIPSVRACSPGC